MRELFPGIYKFRGKLWTKNLVPGTRVYNETLVSLDGVEYRSWDPFRSKLAAAILRGLSFMPIKNDSRILYLGIAEGTTASHISDIACDGLIFGVDISEKCIAKLMQVCEKRKNIIPFLGDANKPEEYASYVERISPRIIYQDVSQRNQAEILIKNAELFLPSKGYAMLALKGPSISSTKKPGKIFKKQEKKLSEMFEIVEKVSLAPFEKKHRFYILKKL